MINLDFLEGDIMKRLLVVMPVDDEQQGVLAAAAQEYEICYSSHQEVTAKMVESADVIIGNVSPELLKGCTRLELLQLNSAGANPYADPGVLPHGTKLCCASGAYGLSLAEYMIGEILAVKRNLYTYHDNQKKRYWHNEGAVTSIYGSTVLVWGMGDIGQEFAVRMKAMGSYIIGVRRQKNDRPDYVDEIYTVEQIGELLPRADIIAMSLPGTSETTHIVDEARLRMIKKDAILMNVGRGNAIEPAALLKVLEEGHLGHVILDVTEPEPLPEESPLWSIERVHITPHIAGKFHLRETVNRIVRIAAENVRLLDSGQSLNNQVDLKTGYRK